jgi:hypothetical protein
MALPQDADDDLIKEDIAEVGTTNTVILEKIKRANEDATGEFRTLFLNNVDFTVAPLPDFYIQIVSKYATALFWLKSNGTDQANNQAKEVYAEAERILIQRFLPVGSRV